MPPPAMAPITAAKKVKTRRVSGCQTPGAAPIASPMATGHDSIFHGFDTRITNRASRPTAMPVPTEHTRSNIRCGGKTKSARRKKPTIAIMACAPARDNQSPPSGKFRWWNKAAIPPARRNMPTRKTK